MLRLLLKRRDAGVALSIMLVTVTACGAHEKKWSHGAIAPSAFSPWEGAPDITLPAPLDGFERYLTALRVKWTKEPSAEWPYPASPSFDKAKCGGDKAIVFDFPVESTRADVHRYAAYINAKGLVYCVQDQTLHLGL